MLETNTEEDIKAIRELTGYFEFFIKTIIEDKRFAEIKEKNGITEQKYKKTSFSKAIENILADRERLQEEMNTEILSNAGIYELGFKDGQKNQAKANKYDALVEKIKDINKQAKEKIKKNNKIIKIEWLDSHMSMDDYFKRKRELIAENKILEMKRQYTQELIPEEE